MRFCCSILGVLALVTVTSLQASQADFARGRVLDTPDGTVVQRLTLPDDVYEWIVRSDLGDVRVFNRAQEEVPYNIRRPARRDEFSSWQSLPVFPVPAVESESESGDSLDLRVEVTETGAIVDYRSGASGDDAGAYLVDASALDRAPTELKLTWSGAEEHIAQIRVESSDDLNEWQTLVPQTTVARLESNGSRILRDQFALPRRQSRYLRISQIEGGSPLAITGVEVRHRRSELPERRWRDLAGERHEDGWEFESGGWFPVDRLQLTSSENFIATARLYARSDQQENWRERGQRTFYRSSIAAVVVSSEPLSVREGDRYWRLEFDGEEPVAPVLSVGWLPDEVVFLKQGSAPYVLAYGQAGLEGRPWPLTELLRKLNGGPPVDLTEVPFARALDAQVLGGPDRLVADTEPVNWRTLILWAVLVLGVLAVGAMAFRLLRS